MNVRCSNDTGGLSRDKKPVFLYIIDKRSRSGMEKLPPKVIEFDAIKKERLNKDGCQCGYQAQYLVDEANMIVKCQRCDARVEPFQALLVITERASRYNQQIKKMHEQREAIQSYKPHRVILKKLEQQYNKSSRGKVNLGTKLYPCCPSCKEPFELDEIVDNWIGGINIQQQLYSRQNKQRRDEDKHT